MNADTGDAPQPGVSVDVGGWVRVRFPVDRGTAEVTMWEDGTARVALDVAVYRRQVRGAVVLRDGQVVDNQVEAVQPWSAGRLSQRHLDTCARLARDYLRRAPRELSRAAKTACAWAAR